MTDDRAPAAGAGVSELAAGAFSAWLRQMRGALRGEHGSEVPCGDCTACCTASQFVHVAPDEADTLAHVPAELLFPAPELPGGHVVLGYDERGRCPMLVDGACSIYEHRPRACRTYDCRVFPATGLVPDDKPLVAERARRWRFSYPTVGDREQHDAVRAAVGSVRRRHPDATPTALAVMAVQRLE